VHCHRQARLSAFCPSEHKLGTTMSLAALRRASGLRQLQPLLLRAAASGLAQCMPSPCAIGGSVGGGGLPAAASSHLWRYDSPLLRHLNTAAAEVPACFV
jgi:hypothetical protein